MWLARAVGTRGRGALHVLPQLAASTPLQCSGSVQRSYASSYTLKRSQRFAALTDADVQHFTQLLGEAGVLTDPDAVAPFNKDWMGKYEGHSRLVLRPSTTQEVSAVLSYCNARRLAVVPQGGNTGLVGGSVPVFDEVVLSTRRMTRLVTFDPVSGTLVVQAGCVLQYLDEQVAGAAGWALPLDLGAKGSCAIGGNVSTNAGGLRLLRYGPLHGSVMGLEVVLADGTVLDAGGVGRPAPLRKDNTGYHLKHMFIGAEGTLGVVTQVAIQCVPRPASVQVVFLAVPSWEAVTGLLRAARSALGEVLSAFEFLDTLSMSFVTSHLPGAQHPLVAGDSGASGSAGSPFYVVVETRGSVAEHDVAKLDAFLEDVMGRGLVSDGAVARSETQAAVMWRAREGIAESLSRRGAVYKYDVSLPVGRMYDMVGDVRARLEQLGFKSPDVQVVGYGHVGDGNLHLNVSAPKYTRELEEALEPFVYKWVAAAGGSISAEHGVGLAKGPVLHLSQPPAAISLMRQLKSMMDPHGILNPYKLLPPVAES